MHQKKRDAAGLAPSQAAQGSMTLPVRVAEIFAPCPSPSAGRPCPGTTSSAPSAVRAWRGSAHATPTRKASCSLPAHGSPKHADGRAGRMKQRHRADFTLRSRPARAATKLALVIRPMWCNRAPLGCPVVPDAYCTYVVSLWLQKQAAVAGVSYPPGIPVQAEALRPMSIG